MHHPNASGFSAPVDQLFNKLYTTSALHVHNSGAVNKKNAHTENVALSNIINKL